MACVITTIKFTSLGSSLPPPSHNALLSESDLGGAQREPATAPLMRRLMSVRELAMTGTARTIKWQLCYDVSARTWWMVSEPAAGVGQSEVRGHLQDGAILLLGLFPQY